MGNTIQTYYGARACHAPARAGKAKQAGAFLGMAAQGKQYRTDVLETSGTTRQQGVPGSQSLERFKKEVWEEINSMPWGAGVSIQITEDAFEKMMADSDFKNKMMKLVREDSRGSNVMCGGTLIRIDANGYHGYSYMENHTAAAGTAIETHSKGKSAFYTKKMDQKKLGEKMLRQKRAVAERAADAAWEQREARERQERRSWLL